MIGDQVPSGFQPEQPGGQVSTRETGNQPGRMLGKNPSERDF